MQNSIRSVPPFSFLRIQSQAPLRTNHKHQPQSQYRTTFSLRQNAQAPTNTVHSTRLFCRNFPRSDHVLKKLHLDDLRDSQAPAVSEAPSQYLGPLRLPASFTLNAFAQICAKVRKWGFSVRLARARARSNAPFPQQRHHLHDVQTHCATTLAPFGAIAKTSTNCTRKK